MIVKYWGERVTHLFPLEREETIVETKEGGKVLKVWCKVSFCQEPLTKRSFAVCKEGLTVLEMVFHVAL